MATKWTVKNQEKKEYQTGQGRTDYNIPMLGYRSSFFIFLTLVTVIFVVPYFTGLIFKDYRLPTVIMSGLITGYAIAFAQYYIERKKKADKGFHVLALLLSLFISGAFFMVYYAHILL